MSMLSLLCLTAFAAALLTPSKAWAISYNVSIIVRVPKLTPEGSKIYISGNHKLLGDWKAGEIELVKLAPCTYQFSAYIASETKLEFKFTRGDFSKVEKDPEGFEMQNRVLMVNPQSFNKITCEISSWADIKPANDLPETFSKADHEILNIIGNYELIKNFKSEYLSHARNVVVYLPDGYGESGKKRYPVLYMHDGNNLFDPYISHLDCDWGLDETIYKLTSSNQMNDIIVVGIYNTPDRASEYTPFKSEEYGGGGGESYSKFLINELKPYIDDRFRTLKTSRDTAIGGASFGGIISLYIGLSHPEVFSSMIAISPSLWWADGELLSWAASRKINMKKTKIWIDMGLIEGEEALRHARKFAEGIRKAFPGFANFRYEEFPNAPHNAVAWGKRFHLPLCFVFGAENKN
ncbi:MAG TPA: alpha/beta hydrolase-fold protein [Candidatus Wallbacteria bacterium]|nr:alpha/beta hydrolase-fold protein [Candidatus Wallbacteria bacterium]